MINSTLIKETLTDLFESALCEEWKLFKESNETVKGADNYYFSYDKNDNRITRNLKEFSYQELATIFKENKIGYYSLEGYITREFYNELVDEYCKDIFEINDLHYIFETYIEELANMWIECGR